MHGQDSVDLDKIAPVLSNTSSMTARQRLYVLTVCVSLCVRGVCTQGVAARPVGGPGAIFIAEPTHAAFSVVVEVDVEYTARLASQSSFLPSFHSLLSLFGF